MREVAAQDVGTQPAGTGNTAVVADFGKTARVSIIGIFTIMAFGTLYLARGLLLPITLAFLFALILSPVVRTFRKRGMPEIVTAVLLVVFVAAAIGTGAYTLSGPVSKWVQQAPQIAAEVAYKLAPLRKPLEQVKQIQKQVEEATQPTDGSSAPEVAVQGPGLLGQAAQGMPDVIAGTMLALILLLFLLASGDIIYEKLVGALPTLTDKKLGLRIVKDVEREVSRYLFAVAAINFGLGTCVGAGLYAVGMPNPVLWGVVAMLLNFIPYVGALTGIAIVGLVAAVSFPSITHAAMAPAIYALCAFIEGQFLTPALLGRRLEMNAVAIFLAIAVWGWLWGFIGIFIAVPMLIILKVSAHHVDGLNGIERLLSARRSDTSTQDTG
jgi:predicted PurR-regulated permease PerM